MEYEGECVIKFLIRWSQYEVLVKDLLKKIKDSKINFDLVYGIPRGGLPLAVEISHKLNIPFSNRLKLNLLLNEKDKNHNLLIVDDLVDTGNTIQKTKLQFQKYENINVKVAVLYKKPWSKIIPDFFIEETDRWVVFPYEDPSEEIPEDYKLCRSEV